MEQTIRSGIYESQAKSFMLLASLQTDELKARVNAVISETLDISKQSGRIVKCLFPGDLHKVCFPEKYKSSKHKS